jgi:hypothetical protein
MAIKIARFLKDRDAYVTVEIGEEKASFKCDECKDPKCPHISAVIAAIKSGDLPADVKWYDGAAKLADPGTRFFAALGLALYRIKHRAETGKWPSKLIAPIPSHMVKAKEIEPPTPEIAAVAAATGATVTAAPPPAPPPPVLPAPKPEPVDSQEDLLKEMAKKGGFRPIELD